ncbi:flagellar motor protein MotB [Aestuariispira insulae]|uniref:Chemotaxis protein MotB n=1 Tax=Aestuariispira insulae TaxID=1461337 RepID=A0A3D9HV72_9PROT|nr:flagellar motor protein MotB [Aestuariispira insulae]RED53398.1 chemotaxis protein MotB [Aestuariispira insulae]
MADAFEGDDALKPLILTKKKKIPAEAHGGAWKIAYADFVTAMMAFFLLLWLLNATTEDQMFGISEFFAPTSVAEDETAVGEALKGLAIAVEGAMRSESSRPSVTVAIPTYGEEGEGEEAGELRKSEQEAHLKEAKASDIEQERQLLDLAMQKLRLSVEKMEEFQDIQSSLLIEMTPEGLLIQILDQQKRPMFEKDTAQLTKFSRRLLALVGSIVATLPNDIAITGHTERSGFKRANDFTNWAISGHRAVAAQQWLIDAGLPKERIIQVEGKADTELLNPREPTSERNRRISILLTLENDDEEGSVQDGPPSIDP